MIRTFRLTNEPGGLGLSCSPDGLSLADVPLLRKTELGFVPRPDPEIASLIEAAYGADPTRLHSSLGVIADALNRGDFALAAIAAVLTRTPELTSEAAARLTKIEKRLAKYNRDEPRDWHGRWTEYGAAAPADIAIRAGRGAAIQVADASGSHVSYSETDAPDHDSLFTPIALPEDEADGDESRASTSLEQEFERKYDDLGPVDFAKEVIQFGYRLGRDGENLSPDEKEHALAEYSFLQDRLSFWLAYEYKPATAHANLLSAALSLYQGAINGGLVGVGNLPASMVDVAGGAWAYENVLSGVRPAATKPAPEKPSPPPVRVPKEIDGLGGIVDISEVKIEWKGNIKSRLNWEEYNAKVNPDAIKTPPGSKTFDQHNPVTQEAISEKAIDSLTAGYIKNPQRIYWQGKRYIDEAVDYEPRPHMSIDLDPAKIKSKTIQLAIPEYTSPTQWQHLFRAIIYGKENGVRVVITRIGE